MVTEDMVMEDMAMALPLRKNLGIKRFSRNRNKGLSRLWSEDFFFRLFFQGLIGYLHND
jgi:hypothetical protein